MASCNSCGATITWARTVTGKAAPMERDNNGRWTIEDGVAAPAPLDETFAGQRYTSHFATCPHAKQWRRRDG